MRSPADLLRAPVSARAATGSIGAVLAALLIASSAHAQARGELLYSTHCIACHTTEMHWRDKKAATNWTTLKVQVRRWQDASSLGWTEDDIQDVTRYLNESIYRYPQMSDPIARSKPLTDGRK